MSEKHLKFVRGLPCAVCFSDMSNMHRAAHHLLQGPGRGIGRRTGDEWAIPLCHTPCHADLHADGNEKAYLARHGITDALAMAEAIYEASGDYVNGRRALLKGRQ